MARKHQGDLFLVKVQGEQMHEKKACKWDIRHERLCNVPMYHVIAMRTYPPNQTIGSLSILFGCEWRQNISSSCVHLLGIISSFLLQPYLDQTYARVLVGPYLPEQFYTLFHCLYGTEGSNTIKTSMTSLGEIRVKSTMKKCKLFI